MTLGHDIKRYKNSDTIIVRDIDNRTPCLEILSDISPFTTALYKGKKWDYLCITENTLYLELTNVYANTVYATPLVKELVLQGKVSYNNLGTVVQNVADLSKDYKSDIYYNNIGNDRISTILEAYNRSQNQGKLLIGINNLNEEMLEGDIRTNKGVLMVLNTRLVKDKEVLGKLGNNQINTNIKSLPLGVEIKSRCLKVVTTDEKVTPAYAMAVNHIINNIVQN